MLGDSGPHGPLGSSADCLDLPTMGRCVIRRYKRRDVRGSASGANESASSSQVGRGARGRGYRQEGGVSIGDLLWRAVWAW